MSRSVPGGTDLARRVLSPKMRRGRDLVLREGGKGFPGGGQSGPGGWRSLPAGKPKVSERSSSMILQIFGPYGEIGIMRTSEAGNEAAEGGRGSTGGCRLPAGSSAVGKPQGLPGVPEGIFPVLPPPSRGASRWPRRYPGVRDGHVRPRVGGKWHGIAVPVVSPGKTVDRGPPAGCWGAAARG